MHPTLVINETAPILENRCTINIVDMDTQFIYPYCVADTSFFFQHLYSTQSHHTQYITREQ